LTWAVIPTKREDSIGRDSSIRARSLSLPHSARPLACASFPHLNETPIARVSTTALHSTSCVRRAVARTHRTPRNARDGGHGRLRDSRGGIEPLRGRDADGRMVREPRRDSAKAETRPPPRRRVGRESSSASVSSYGGGRGEGRDVVSIIAWHSPWLSQATRTVDLRSPVDRRSIATPGDRMADGRRALTCRARRGHFKLGPGLDAGVGRHGNCFSLALISSLRIAPSIRRLVDSIQKQAGRSPLPSLLTEVHL
jgi:hypothetical protein